MGAACAGRPRPPGAGLSSVGVGEPCLCTQPWTDGTQRPCLLLGRGGVFEGRQPALASVSSAAHGHRPQGSERSRDLGRVHRAPQLLTSSPWEEGSSGPGRGWLSCRQLFRVPPVGHAVVSEAPMAVGRQDSSSRYRAPWEGEAGAGGRQLRVCNSVSSCSCPCPVSVAEGRLRLPTPALLRYDSQIKLVCVTMCHVML